MAREVICGIYAIVNSKTGKIYIGRSCDILTRKRVHKLRLENGTHANIHLQSSYKIYRDFFKFYIIEKCLENELNEREKYWIDYYGGIDSNLNYNMGGINGGRPNNESRQKISDKRKGYKHTPETIQKLRDSHKGYIMPEEQKRKIGESCKGHPVPYKGRIGNILKNSKKFQEAIKNKNYKHSDETKNKIRKRKQQNNKWFKAISPNGDEYFYNNVTDFARLTKLTVACIFDCLNKISIHHKGWLFSYLSSEETDLLKGTEDEQRLFIQFSNNKST